MCWRIEMQYMMLIMRSLNLCLRNKLEWRDQLECLGYVLPQDLTVGLILNGLTKDFARFVRNHNIHNMGKTIGELHVMLIECEKGLPKKAETPQVMMIKGGKIQKAKNKSLKAKGKDLTTLPLSFWDYALESATHILNMVPTKKALVKQDTPDKLQQRSVKCIFIGYLKETMGYYFYFSPENKIVVTRHAEFFEKNIITQKVSGRAIDLEEIQDEDTSPSEITSEIPMEVEGFEPPQEEVIPILRSERTHRAPNRLCLNVKAEEHSLGDLNEPTSYKAAMLDSESNNSKQSTTAMSAIEAGYIAASEAAIEAVWIRKFISGLGARHYHRRYHYVRESIALGEIRFLKVHTDDNLANPFTKALSKGKLTQHARSMGLHLVIYPTIDEDLFGYLERKFLIHHIIGEHMLAVLQDLLWEMQWMCSISSWKTVIDHFQLRLSSWKANLLSIRGRLTLIKSVLGSLGGLNIGSLKAFNLAFLQKWQWRMPSSPNSLWVKVIKSFHGQEGGFDSFGCKFKAGCGTQIRFWKDIWLGETPLCSRYNKLYRLDLDKDCLIIDKIDNGNWNWNWSRTNLGTRNLAYFRDLLNEIGDVNIDVAEDTCSWSLGSIDIYRVKEARHIIDLKTLPSLTKQTTWDNALPRKVNIFTWRLSLDRLPHRLNLSSRGMDIMAISCPSCNANVESANHIDKYGYIKNHKKTVKNGQVRTRESEEYKKKLKI
ncbi:retrotransposon protein, putative, ty1-copia subclass [Tanacetum coccineum]